MARILISKNGELLKQIPITADRTRIGRGPINQLCFVDSTISRFHAQIVRRGLCYVIEDKKSVNGTRLNGSLLAKKEILSDYDEIVIGEYTLVFLSDETDSPVTIHPESFDASATVYDLRR